MLYRTKGYMRNTEKMENETKAHVENICGSEKLRGEKR